MATIDDLRTRLRVRLEETAAAVWSDPELDACLSGALADYGRWHVDEAIAAVAVAEGATSVPVPMDAIGVRRVILADGFVVPPRMLASRRTADEALAWEAYAGSLYLTQPLEAQTLTIWYTTPYTFATLPVADEELVLLGAIAGALAARAIQDFKRGDIGGDGLVERARQAADRAMAERRRRIVAGNVATS